MTGEEVAQRPVPSYSSLVVVCSQYLVVGGQVVRGREALIHR